MIGLKLIIELQSIKDTLQKIDYLPLREIALIHILEEVISKINEDEYQAIKQILEDQTIIN